MNHQRLERPRGHQILIKIKQSLEKDLITIREELSDLIKTTANIDESNEIRDLEDLLTVKQKKLNDVKKTLSETKVIEPQNLPITGKIKFGTKAEILDETGKSATYEIVGETESNVKNGLISYKSPLGEKLIGCIKGDCIDVVTPSGSRTFEVINILSN
ncbi:GreA/GreB family elongation factor [Photobacterium leiognathi]|uniref:GreA/GreB family elongation factor n=1 Tax=Photobacterium leiognathi TaxID=553611 RepID=UPI0029826E16|nr:GreA/GreB family elongation factor [Photobacterium leiognathi]